MRTHYESNLTMKEALAHYFQANNFGEDGGYHDAWVDFKLGPIPLPFPNTAARKRAVPIHDFHHILTEYQTTTLGEFEISAWELGAGCKDFYAAWQLNLSGLLAGAFSMPRRTWRAFIRGRNTQSLYGSSYDAVLQKTVQEARVMTQLDTNEAFKARPIDALLFAAAMLGGALSGLFFLAMMIVGLPVLLVVSLLRRKSLQPSKP